ncbi:MAG TPA: 3-oxoacyl-ACP reductase FabG [Candidatus Ozemobacteraceae bacterium]
MRLQDKVTIITGAGAGIGRAAALLFASEGAKVYAWDLRPEGLESLKQESKGAVKTIAVDVTDSAAVKAAVDTVVAAEGRIDVLVNNAGITADALLVKMEESAWDRVISVNLKGVFNCSQAVVKAMIEKGTAGSIINTSSVVGVYGNVGQVNYAATKAGVIGITKSLAKEMGRKGIRVNAVAPGFIITDMTAKMPEKILTMMKEKAPLQRHGTVDDVARCYLFLASDDASFISGQVLGVDGGLVL